MKQANVFILFLQNKCYTNLLCFSCKFHLLVVTLDMQKILTPKATERLERNKRIIKEYKKLFVPGSHKTAVCDRVAENIGVKRHGVYKVVNAYLKENEKP